MKVGFSKNNQRKIITFVSGAFIFIGILLFCSNTALAADTVTVSNAYLAANQTVVNFDLNEMADGSIRAFFNDVQNNPDDYVYGKGTWFNQLWNGNFFTSEAGVWEKVSTGEIYSDIGRLGEAYGINYEIYSTDSGPNQAANEAKAIAAETKAKANLAQNQANVQSAQNAAKENTSPGKLEQILGSMIAWFLYYIAVGLGWIMMLVTKVMLVIGVFNSFLKQPAVQAGWVIARDICNNFFIIFMMIMAAGVTLHLPNYAWRSMLPKILLYAVLINFSLTITGILIDVSQVIMLTFASPLATTQGYNIIISAFNLPDAFSMSRVLDVWKNSNTGQIDISQTGGLSFLDIVAALLFAVIVTIVAIVIIVCITAILIYRIIMLMFLVVLSPLYFLSKASNISALGSMGNEWMSKLSSMLAVGPAIFFFLYLSFMTMATVNNYTVSGGSAATQPGLLLQDNNLSAQVGNASNLTNTGTAQTTVLANQIGGSANADYTALSNMASVQGVLNFLIVIGLLWASLMMGKKFGDAAGSFAGQGMGWISSAAKKYSGFNLAKRAPAKIKGMAGEVGTFVDDRLKGRQRLYSGIYQLGGKYVPFAREKLGTRIGALETGTAKRFNATVQAVGQAAGVDNMNEEQLRKLANSGKKYERIAATQAMMKKGLIRDDETDESKKRNNINLINQARAVLAGTDLGKEFDDNLRKYTPNTALNTIYDKDGKLNREKFESDLKTGKLDIAKIMGALDKPALEKLRDSIGAGDALVRFIMQYGAGDLSKIDKSMSSEIKKEVWKDVSHETFAKRDASGNIIRDTAGNVISYDTDRRKEYLAAKNDVMKAFDISSREQREEARKYFSENRSKVLENMAVSGMSGDFIKNFGDLASVKDLDKFADRSEEAKQKLQSALNEALSGVDFSLLNQASQKLADDILKKQVIISGKVAAPAGGREALNRILSGLKAEDAERIRWDGLDATGKQSLAMNLDPNTLRIIGMRGNNNTLIKGVRQVVDEAAVVDNEQEKEFNNARNKYLNAKKKLDDILAQIDRLSNEEVIAKNANDLIEASKINQRLVQLRQQIISENLQNQAADAQNIYNRAASKYANRIDSAGNWIRSEAQKRQQDIRGKKKPAAGEAEEV